jgi:hypothetical protein
MDGEESAARVSYGSAYLATAPLRSRGKSRSATACSLRFAVRPARGQVERSLQPLTVEGYRHTVFSNPSTCADRYETHYFINGSRCGQRMACPSDRNNVIRNYS